jgi:hypothetical protein
MWTTTSARPGIDMLDLFDLSARNVRDACGLVDELMSSFPERQDLAAEILACERRAPISSGCSASKRRPSGPSR